MLSYRALFAHRRSCPVRVSGSWRRLSDIKVLRRFPDASTSKPTTTKTFDKMGVFSTSVVLLSLAVCGTLAGRSLPGGWRTRDPYSDPAFAELAHYAVSSQAGDSKFYDTVLELLQVQTQVVAGMNYRLKFSTAETACKIGVDEYSRERCLPKVNLPKATCTAVVYERAWQNHREVTSYKCV